MSPLPVGKLRADALRSIFEKLSPRDPRVIVGPRVGEDAAVIDLGDRYLIATSDPITFAGDDVAWYALQVNANDVAVRPAFDAAPASAQGPVLDVRIVGVSMGSEIVGIGGAVPVRLAR